MTALQVGASQLSPLCVWETVGNLQYVPSAWEEHQEGGWAREGPLTSLIVTEHLHAPGPGLGIKGLECQTKDLRPYPEGNGEP